MTLEQIMDEWDKDSHIDITDLSIQSLEVAKLHAKYWRIAVRAQLKLDALEIELSRLKRDKYQMYTQGPSKEMVDKGWGLPSIGKVNKTETDIFIKGDEQYTSLMTRISVQKRKVDFVESICRLIPFRANHIKNAIEFEKFKVGA